MNFEEWKKTARFVVAGPEMPDHAMEMGVKAAWVFDDDAFIEVGPHKCWPGAVGRTVLKVVYGIEEEWFSCSEFTKAAALLWDMHSESNYEGGLTVFETMRRCVRMDDLDAACARIQDLLGVTDGGLAAMHLDEDDWAAADWEERMDMFRHYVRVEIEYVTEV